MLQVRIHQAAGQLQLVQGAAPMLQALRLPGVNDAGDVQSRPTARRHRRLRGHVAQVGHAVRLADAVTVCGSVFVIAAGWTRTGDGRHLPGNSSTMVPTVEADAGILLVVGSDMVACVSWSWYRISVHIECTSI